MSYKAITAVLYDASQARAVLPATIALARHSGAQVHVLCVGVDSTDAGYYYAGAQAIAVQQNLDVAMEEANKLRFHAEAVLSSAQLPYEIDVTTVTTGSLSDVISDWARFFDAAVLAMPYQTSGNPMDVIAFEACLFTARCPMFMVPYAPRGDYDFTRALIAWDDGAQAMAAVRAAAPLLKQSCLALVTMIDPSLNTQDRSDPGGRLGEMLMRMGAKIDIAVLGKTHESIASQLLNQTRAEDAGFIVMGAYRHSRLREAILGGTTRDIMQYSDVPVMLAH